MRRGGETLRVVVGLAQWRLTCCLFNKLLCAFAPLRDNFFNRRGFPRRAFWRYLSLAPSLCLSLALLSGCQPKRANRPVGIVNGCQKTPPFVGQLGFSNPALSTSEKSRPGLWVIEAKENGRRYQHPSWTKAGFLAPIERDAEGNVFVAPAPVINTLLNPPAEQNAIWRVDGKTQAMERFIKLPDAAPPNEQNVYGALGLAYDCDTASLYVASVFGSKRDQEAGRVYRVDTKTKQVAAQLDNVDAFGLRVFNSVKGKRLYYGLGRKSEIWSADLNDAGNFTGTPSREISLDGLGPRGNDKARRLNFTANNEMSVFGIEFDFNLIAPTEKQETVYRFRYDAFKDAWIYLPDAPQTVN